MTSNFRTALERGGVIVFDGAMGTELAARGVEPGTAANITASETVLAVHRAYRKAGADALITNTFGVSAQIPIAGAKTTKDLENICQKACQYAREAAADDGYAAGDIGPTGKLLDPYGTFSEATLLDAFRQTARFLAAGGVDLFVVETMSDARELTLAVHACREAARQVQRDIPVAASMAFDPRKQGGFRTNMGVSPAQAAQAMIAAGADIIGANCGSVTPAQMAEIVREFRSVTKQHPILAQPNAGVPELQAGRTVFRLAPEAYAVGMLEVIAAGARLVGGCCGTTPEHIRCLRQAVERK